MAGTAVIVDLGGFADWCRETGRALAELDFTPALKQCKLAIRQSVMQNITEGHGPDGKAWPSLKHKRVYDKGSSKGPLYSTGLLLASITAGRGHVEELTSSHLLMGTNLEYAAIHQHGGEIRPKKKYLSIPLTREASRAGGASQFPRPLFVIESGTGKLFLAESKTVKGGKNKGKRKTGKGSLLIHYLLSKGVTVPARPFLGISANLAANIGDIFYRFMQRQMKAK